MSLIEINQVTMKFGGLTAVKDVSFNVGTNDLIAIIGPNGAGKTTLFNMITGIYEPSISEIKLLGEKISAKKPSDITQLGIARTFQNIRLFNHLTVIDNIKIARHTRIQYSFFDGIFRTKKYKTEEEKITNESLEVLKLFHLDDKKDYLAKNLPYWAQRKLEMARALATQPKLLLLDEPAAGMNPTETKELSNLIKFIREKFQIAVILIEHDMNLVMEIAEKIYVLDYGNLIASGAPSEIQNNKKVIEAYLGAEI